VGALSKSLTRVRDEILTLREKRERLLSGLQLHTVDRKRVVSRMLARFSNDLVEIARRRRQVRMVVLTDLKQTVLRLRQETRESLGGAREAFWSLGSAAPSAAARVRPNRQAATHPHCEEHPRWKADEAEPARSAKHVRTKIERRRKGVRHPHRP
jgi:hypothetical protein